MKRSIFLGGNRLPAAFTLPVVLGFGLILASGCLNPAQPMPPSPPLAAVTPTAVADDDRFPAVLDAQLTRATDGTFDIAVTLSSPYDTPDRYADGWRVLAPDGTVLGEHTLLHDHANEQPFTRTQYGVIIPSDLLTVTIEGHDRVNGYGGGTLTIQIKP
jgi:hypothetical protein